MADFEKVYREVFPRIHGYICLRIEPRTAAADVTQEVMIEAWKNWHTFLPEKGKTPEAWFLGIAKHRVADYWRRNRSIFPLDDTILEKNPSLSIEQQGKQQDARVLLENLFKELTDEEKRLLSLRYIDELSHKEIATLCNKNPATIRKYFSRLETRLNQQFGNEWNLLNS